MKPEKEEQKTTLDNTLRYLYSTLRNRGATLVAIEFKHGGRTWRADTVEEAIELRDRLEMEDRIAIESGEDPDWREEQVWTPETAKELLDNLGEYQKAFLRTLHEHRGVWMASEDILKETKLDSEVAFAGVLSGLSKQLKKINLRPSNLYEV